PARGQISTAALQGMRAARSNRENPAFSTGIRTRVTSVSRRLRSRARGGVLASLRTFAIEISACGFGRADRAESRSSTGSGVSIRKGASGHGHGRRIKTADGEPTRRRARTPHREAESIDQATVEPQVADATGEILTGRDDRNARQHAKRTQAAKRTVAEKI